MPHFFPAFTRLQFLDPVLLADGCEAKLPIAYGAAVEVLGQVEARRGARTDAVGFLGYVSHQQAVQAERRQLRASRQPESAIDALFTRERDDSEARLGREPHAAHVGAFEGANYEARGYYRPQANCIMFTRDRVPFCAVCRRAIERVIDLYTAK